MTLSREELVPITESIWECGIKGISQITELRSLVIDIHSNSKKMMTLGITKR